MKLLGSTKDTIDADKNSENVPKLENVEVVLVHCNLVNNAYQQHSRVLFTFVPTKQYGQLISISPHSLVFFKKIYFLFCNESLHTLSRYFINLFIYMKPSFLVQ